MTYCRVLPRDLFNDANLLKCVGKLWLETEGMPSDIFRFDQDDVLEFDIRQNADDGSTTVDNITLTIRGETYCVKRPLNSREPWPLYLFFRSDPHGDEFEVFDDDGNLSSEFHELTKTK